MQNAGRTSQWHTAEWGAWGWLETILKLIAVFAGAVAFASTDASAPLRIGDNPHVIALALIALLALGSLAQVTIRFIQRETISFAFSLFNLAGHLAALVAVLRVPQPPTWVLLFGVFYLLGQLVKLQFLRVTGYTEGGSTSSGMQLVAVAQGAVYALFAILMLF